jgi:hypothetical protein
VIVAFYDVLQRIHPRLEQRTSGFDRNVEVRRIVKPRVRAFKSSRARLCSARLVEYGLIKERSCAVTGNSFDIEG